MNYIPSTSIVWALAEVTVDQCPAHRCGRLLGSLATTRLSATAVSFVTPGIFTWERDRDERNAEPSQLTPIPQPQLENKGKSQSLPSALCGEDTQRWS